ncbi:MAG: hypothetical protein COB37_11490 [Kordiimonadales bacterium]|nr:MAG: hypothetical protein COB37_11490 [Kordiimonadales bacterium]
MPLDTQQSNGETDATPGVKTRAKLKLIDAISVLVVLGLALEFWFNADQRMGNAALWMLIAVILANQFFKRRLRCPGCGCTLYASWQYSYGSKVADKCRDCGKAVP